MTLSDLRFSIASALSREITLSQIDAHTAQVWVPFYFPDGDGLVVHLRDAGGDDIEVTDSAHTFMHIGYHDDVDALRSGTRGGLLESIKLRHGVEDRNGELLTHTTRGDVGQAVFGFVQALLEVSDLRNLSRANVRHSFREDVAELLAGLPGMQTGYVNAARDPDGLYVMPYVMNGVDRPIAVYDINTNENATEAVLVVEKHAAWTPAMEFVAIERDQTTLGRKQTARLSQAFGKQFPAFQGHADEIVAYLEREHAVSRQLTAARALPEPSPEDGERKAIVAATDEDEILGREALRVRAETEDHE